MSELKIVGQALPNMPWEDRPEGCKDVVWRYSANPIIPRDLLPTSNSIFNSAVVRFGEGYAGVFRCDDTNRRMRLHVGFSDDAINWNINPEPLTFECEDKEIGEWVYGYDPRVVFIEDRYYVTWCNGYHGPTIGVAYTFDFKTFHQLENAFLPFNRNGVLFPRKLNGNFAMLSRPSDNGHTPFGDIFYSESPDLEYWGRHRHVMSPAPFEDSAWQCTKIGAGPIPIETSEGWLLIYHGVLASCNGFVYAFGSALLDLDEPWKVKFRSGPYLISPREQYECMGDVPNVTFPCAALHDAETGRIAIYYGCADTVTGLAFGYINEIVEEAKMTANKEAKRIVIQSIQRLATETAIENSVTVFHIESDEIKGRIIGREGRNIRALEAATGIEIIVDDTPEAIVLSSFDPVRREVARLALHQLVQDGRIHPARIEEVVSKVRKQIEEEIIETGKRTVIDLGIHGMHPELIRLIGKMKYRSSYGQNLLQHSRETANLCAVMASELGLNPKHAKRAGLLHDIGKVPDDEPELPHALLGMKLCEKYKEKANICNAVGAHHDEVEMESLIAPIVQVCDAISGARPGARREIVEAYIKRLNDLEQLALSYPGVVKTYAIQAGRELRVIVGAENTDDSSIATLSAEIAKRIQDEMTYPGQVKITVIRETRSVSYAK